MCTLEDRTDTSSVTAGTARLITTVARIRPQFAQGSRFIGTSTVSGIMAGTPHFTPKGEGRPLRQLATSGWCSRLLLDPTEEVSPAMPDWFYRTVSRPLLFRLPARVARDLALGFMGR